MKVFWMGLCVTVAVMTGCGPTPVTRARQEANAEDFDLAAADRLLAHEAEAVPEGEGVRPPENDLVVNQEVRLLSEGAAVSREPLPEPEPVPDVPNEKAIQTALRNVGLYDGAIDGKIGPKTLAAIEKFQEEHDLKVDGRVGPKTWAVLKEAYRKEKK